MSNERLSISRRGRRGFTVAELTMAMVVLTLVLGATSSLTMTVGQYWETTDQSQALQISGVETSRRLEEYLRSAAYIGLVCTGSVSGTVSPAGTVVLWQSDIDNGATTGNITLSEIAMIQHNATSQTLYYYHVVFPSNLTTSQRSAADKTYSYATICGSTFPATFAATQYVTSQPLCRNVAGARFVAENVGSTTLKPLVEYQLNLTRTLGAASAVTNESYLHYGSVTLRSPQSQPP